MSAMNSLMITWGWTTGERINRKVSQSGKRNCEFISGIRAGCKPAGGQRTGGGWSCEIDIGIHSGCKSKVRFPRKSSRMHLSWSEIDRSEHLHSIRLAERPARSSIRSGRGPLKAERRVRFPYALPFIVNDLQEMQ